MTTFVLTLGQPMDNGKLMPAEGDLHFDSLSVDSEKSAEETLGVPIAVLSPAYCSEVKGDTPRQPGRARLQERDREMLEAGRRLRI